MLATVDDQFRSSFIADGARRRRHRTVTGGGGGRIASKTTDTSLLADGWCTILSIRHQMFMMMIMVMVERKLQMPFDGNRGRFIVHRQHVR